MQFISKVYVLFRKSFGKVNNSQAHRGTNMIRELISFTFDPSDALTPSYICCSCVRAAEIGEILEKAFVVI